MWRFVDPLKRWFSQKLRRFLEPKDVRAIADKNVRSTQDVIAVLTRQYQSHELSFDEWAKAMREEVRDGHMQQYLLGRGGVKRMAERDYERVTGLIQEQLRYLEEFIHQVQVGMVTDQRMLIRAGMYALATGAAYELGRAGDTGNWKEERWTMTAAEHCQDCIAFAGQGWQPIGTFPMPRAGSTQCLSNCKCYKEYR